LAAPFEIVAMDDESHPKLRIALESLLNQTTRLPLASGSASAARFGSIASGLQIVGETSLLHSFTRILANKQRKLVLRPVCVNYQFPHLGGE
jgi:hypothetical protein